MQSESYLSSLLIAEGKLLSIKNSNVNDRLSFDAVEC